MGIIHARVCGAIRGMGADKPRYSESTRSGTLPIDPARQYQQGPCRHRQADFGVGLEVDGDAEDIGLFENNQVGNAADGN